MTRLPLPHCKSPDHPPEAPRDQMILVDETGKGGLTTHYVFACVPCRDIRKIISAQVVCDPRFRTYIQNEPRMLEYKRAVRVLRDPTGRRIKYFK
jgi:hypothetical protein